MRSGARLRARYWIASGTFWHEAAHRQVLALRPSRSPGAESATDADVGVDQPAGPDVRGWQPQDGGLGWRISTVTEEEEMIWWVWCQEDGSASAETVDEQDCIGAAIRWARRRFEQDPDWGSRILYGDIEVRAALAQPGEDVQDETRGYLVRLSGLYELCIDGEVVRR